MHICIVYSWQSQLLRAGKKKNEKRRGETQTPVFIAIQTVTRSIVAAEKKKKKKGGKCVKLKKQPWIITIQTHSNIGSFNQIGPTLFYLNFFFKITLKFWRMSNGKSCFTYIGWREIMLYTKANFVPSNAKFT